MRGISFGLETFENSQIRKKLFEKPQKNKTK